MRRPTALGGDGISSQDVWPRWRSSANVMISSRGFTAQQESLTPDNRRGCGLRSCWGMGRLHGKSSEVLGSSHP